MSRTIGAAVQSALAAAHVPLLVFVELDFSGGFVRVTNAPYAFDWNGYTWTGLGRLGGIDAVKEGSSLEARGIALKLSGVPVSGEGASENISIALNQTYQGRDCRVWVAPLGGGDSHLSLPGTSGNYASTPDSAAIGVTDEFDIRAKVASDDWTLGLLQAVMSQDVVGGRSWGFRVNAVGRLAFYISFDGAVIAADNTSTVSVGFSDGAIGWVRMTRTVAGLLRFYTSSDGIEWTQLGADVSQTAGSLFNSSAPLQVGARLGNGANDPFRGRIYYAELRNGIDGAVVADFDASRDDLSSKGTPWTINKSGADYARIIRNPFAILADPKLIFLGRMDYMDIDVGQVATITLFAESRLADLERPRVRRYNGADQRAEYPDDAGLDFAEAMVERNLTWGRSR